MDTPDPFVISVYLNTLSSRFFSIEFWRRTYSFISLTRFNSSHLLVQTQINCNYTHNTFIRFNFCTDFLYGLFQIKIHSKKSIRDVSQKSKEAKRFNFCYLLFFLDNTISTLVKIYSTQQVHLLFFFSLRPRSNNIDIDIESPRTREIVARINPFPTFPWLLKKKLRIKISMLPDFQRKNALEIIGIVIRYADLVQSNNSGERVKIGGWERGKVNPGNENVSCLVHKDRKLS